MNDNLGTYYISDGKCDVGKGIALEFALFLTVFVCALGVAAFLALTLYVEQDRKVYIYPQCSSMYNIFFCIIL